MSFSSENREKTLRFVLTFHGQATDKVPTGYRHITNSRPTGSLYFRQNLSADSRPTDGRQVFWGALLHNYRKVPPVIHSFYGQKCAISKRNCVFVFSMIVIGMVFTGQEIQGKMNYFKA